MDFSQTSLLNEIFFIPSTSGTDNSVLRSSEELIDSALCRPFCLTLKVNSPLPPPFYYPNDGYIFIFI